MASKICSKSCFDRTGASESQSANSLRPRVLFTFSMRCFCVFWCMSQMLAPTQRKHTFSFYAHICSFVLKHGPRHFFQQIVRSLLPECNCTLLLKCSPNMFLVPDNKTRMMQALPGEMPLVEKLALQHAPARANCC